MGVRAAIYQSGRNGAKGLCRRVDPWAGARRGPRCARQCVPLQRPRNRGRAMVHDEEEPAKIIAEPGAVPGSLRHEIPQNGSQSQSAAEPEMVATQLPEAELSLTPPPEAQSPGEPQFFLESQASEVPPPETPAPEPVDSAPLVFAPPPRLAGEQTKSGSVSS